MQLFYIIFTRLYFFGIRLASIFNPKAEAIIKGHKNWRKNLINLIDKNENYIWVHCASLGEFEQGRPLIEKFKSDPLTQNYKILLSFFSPSGYEIRKNYDQVDIVCYLPFDTNRNANDFIKIVNPVFAVFVKYEFWHFYLTELKNRTIPTYIISAIFRKNQMFFKSYGGFFLKSLKSFKHIFVQDDNSKNLLLSKNITNVDVCGDTRIDRVVKIASENYENQFIADFTRNKFTIVCGSTWPDDERLLAEFINKSSDEYKFIIAPHEIDQKHLDTIQQWINVPTILLSEIENKNPSDYKLVIVNSIGLLSKLYRFGNMAYIGGGFGKGLHNILEAAVYEIPVVFGPNYQKFKEAVDLVKLNASFSIKTQNELSNIIIGVFDGHIFDVDAKIKAKQYISHSSGSTQHIFTKMHLIGEF